MKILALVLCLLAGNAIASDCVDISTPWVNCPFENNLLDVSGNGNNGVNTSSIPFATSPVWQGAYSIGEFTPSTVPSGYVDFPAPAGQPFTTGTGSISIAFFNGPDFAAAVEANGAGTCVAVVSDDDSGGLFAYALPVTGSTATLIAATYTISSPGDTFTLNDGLWHVATLVDDGSTLTAYLDDSGDGGVPVTDGSDILTDPDVQVGGDDVGDNGCGTYEDSLYVYSCALTGAQVAELATQPTPTPTFSISPTNSPTPTSTPTFTMTDTPWPTPTPDGTPVPTCASPWPAIFTVQVSPIAAPTNTVEDGSIQEPFVIKIGDSYHLTVSAGGWNNQESIELFTGPTPMGPFTLYGTVIGGAGSAAGVSDPVAMSTQLSTDGGTTWRIYFSDRSNYNYEYVTSTDGGFTYSNPQIALTAYLFDDPPTGTGYCSTVANVDSAGIRYDSSCSCYQMTLEVDTGGCVNNGVTLNPYVIWYFQSTDGGDTFHPMSNAPLSSMGRGSDYAGTRSLTKTGGTWITWPHDSNDIYFATSPDLFNWTPSSLNFLGPSSGLFGVANPNQVADGSVLFVPDSAHGNTYVYASSVDNSQTNPNYIAAVGVAHFPGNLNDYISCLQPTVTQTFTITMTSTPTAAPPTPNYTATSTFTDSPVLPPTPNYTATDTPTPATPTFTLSSTRTFTVTPTPTQTALQFQILVVAGGGGGGNAVGGGGGAGGVIQTTSGTLGTQSIYVVGTGGAPGANGSDSSYGSITATGGGAGGSSSAYPVMGGSGGGGGSGTSGGTYSTGAAGVAGQGYFGGNGFYSSEQGGGGGGAGGAGTSANHHLGQIGGAGGIGFLSSISGSGVYYGIGGGGGGQKNVGTAGTGYGAGGGGATIFGGATSGTQGVVIISYPATYGGTFTATGDYTEYESGGNIIYVFTGDGTFAPLVAATATPTSTDSPGYSPTDTPTITVSPTVSPTFTETPMCGIYGQQTPVGFNALGNGVIIYKQITLGFPNQAFVSSISAYIENGNGKMQAAVYSNLNNQPLDVLEISNTIYAISPDWNAVTFGTDDLAPGKYWLAVEVQNTAQIQFSGPGTGTDLYGYQQFGVWPSPAIIQTFLGNASIQGFVCGY